jgi:hypothetical protein
VETAGCSNDNDDDNDNGFKDGGRGSERRQQLAFSLAKKNAGDLALFHRMIRDIYWTKTDNIWGSCVCEVSVHNISDG